MSRHVGPSGASSIVIITVHHSHINTEGIDMAQQRKSRWSESIIGMGAFMVLGTLAVGVMGMAVDSPAFAQGNLSDVATARKNCLDANNKANAGNATMGVRVEKELVWNPKSQTLSSDNAKIAELRPGGPAEMAGLQVGDFLKWVVDIQTGSGKPAFRENDLVEGLSHYAPGERIKIVVSRDGKERVFEVVLGRGDGSLMGGDESQSASSVYLDCIRALWGIELQETSGGDPAYPSTQFSYLTAGKLTKTGPAYAAGLRTGDNIIQLGVDDKPTAAKLLDAIRGAKTERPVMIKYLAGSKEVLVANVQLQSLNDRNGNAEFAMMERFPGSAKAIMSNTPQSPEGTLETLYQARLMKLGPEASEKKSPYWGKTDEELVQEAASVVQSTQHEQKIGTLLELMQRANRMSPSGSNLQKLAMDLIPQITTQFTDIGITHSWEIVEFFKNRWDQKLRTMLSAVVEHKIRELQHIPATSEAMGQADVWESVLRRDLTYFFYPPNGQEYPELKAALTALEQHRKAAPTHLPDGMLFSGPSWSLVRTNMKQWCTQEAFVDHVHADPGWFDENTKFFLDGATKQLLMGQVVPLVREHCPSAKKITVTNYLKERSGPINQYVFSEVDQSVVVRGIDGNPPASSLAEARSIARKKASPCDLQAADPVDPEKPRLLPGVADADVVSEKAIEACLAAVKADPKNRRFKFQLGRALLLGGLSANAAKILTPLAESGYGGAQAYLARLFAAGVGVGKDVDRANRLSASAKDNGYDPVWTAQREKDTPLELSGYRNSRLIRNVYDLSPALFQDQINSDIHPAYIIHMMDTIMAVCPKQFLSMQDDYTALRERHAKGKDPRTLVDITNFDREVLKGIAAAGQKTRYTPRNISTLRQMMEGGSADGRTMVARERCEGKALATFAERSREYLRQVKVPE